MKYKFTGDAYLLGIKLNNEIIIIENEKDNISIEKAIQNVILSVKGFFKKQVTEFVIITGSFYYDEHEYNAFELQIPNTIEKMAHKTLNDQYAFFPIPHKIEQLYFMRAIEKDIFTIEEFTDAFMTDKKLGLYYNDKPVPYSLYHMDKKQQVMKNEQYPNRWFNYDEQNKCYTMFDSILQVKSA
mgnify:FL=1